MLDNQDKLNIIGEKLVELIGLIDATHSPLLNKIYFDYTDLKYLHYAVKNYFNKDVILKFPDFDENQYRMIHNDLMMLSMSSNTKIQSFVTKFLLSTNTILVLEGYLKTSNYEMICYNKNNELDYEKAHRTISDLIFGFYYVKNEKTSFLSNFN